MNLGFPQHPLNSIGGPIAAQQPPPSWVNDFQQWQSGHGATSTMSGEKGEMQVVLPEGPSISHTHMRSDQRGGVKTGLGRYHENSHIGAPAMHLGGVTASFRQQPLFQPHMAEGIVHAASTLKISDELNFEKAFAEFTNEKDDTQSQAQQEKSDAKSMNTQNPVAPAKLTKQEHGIDMTDEMASTKLDLTQQARYGADTILPHIDDDNETVEEDVEFTNIMAEQGRRSLESVAEIMASNPRFANSQFYQLMRQFRDREVYIGGKEIVARKGFVVEHHHAPGRAERVEDGAAAHAPTVQTRGRGLSATAAEFMPRAMREEEAAGIE